TPFGQSVTLTARLTPATATGTVTFFENPNSLGTVNVSNGTATFSTASLSVGNHNLVAFYAGDANNNSSNSNVIALVVNQATTRTTLAASPTSASPGQTVTLTATVTPAAATGNVMFREGAVTIGTGTLSGGTASLTTSTLTGGNHAITATYNGDTNFASSTS